MSDPIDRQSAIDAMRKCQTYRFSVTEPRMIMLADAEEVIEELPSAQLTHDCDTCRYNHLEWDEEPCDSCTAGGENNHWKPVQPEQWIPCSERLPEDYTDVLVWFEYFRYGNYNRPYQMYGIGSYSSQYDSWLINQETGWNELKVFAWMPLPEPYREEGEE